MNSSISVDSDLTIEKTASVSIVASQSSSSSIDVNGCVSIDGELEIVVDFELKEKQEYDLIKYNCSQIAVVPSGVKLVYDRQQNECLDSKINITPNTISTTINRCSGKKKKKNIFILTILIIFFFSKDQFQRLFLLGLYLELLWVLC